VAAGCRCCHAAVQGQFRGCESLAAHEGHQHAAPGGIGDCTSHEGHVWGVGHTSMVTEAWPQGKANLPGR